MNISVVGFGKAGKSLSHYFRKKGHKIKYICDINNENIKKEVEEVEGLITDDFELIGKESNIIILALPDSNIEDVWNKIKPFIRENLVFHLSGVKEGIYEDKSLYALHPAAPMTGNGNLDNIVFGLENSGERVEEIKDFIVKCGNEVVLIEKGTKSRYHLANVIVSNLVLSLFQRGLENLKKCGISEEDGMKLLMPLAKLNLSNIESKGLVDAVTGPVERKDFDTVEKHLEVIDKEDLDLYKILSGNIEKILGRHINNLFL